MKNTIKNIIEHSGMDSRLVRGIIRQCGGVEQWEYAMDTVVNGGAQAGVSGFIYYDETVGFWRKQRKAITELLESGASEFGVDVIGMVAGFSCLKGDEYTYSDIARAIYGQYNDEYDYVYNVLAWFALETLAFRCEGMK